MNIEKESNPVGAIRLAVAVPGVRLVDGAAALHTDRGYSAQVASSVTGSTPIAPYLLRHAQSVKWQIVNLQVFGAGAKRWSIKNTIQRMNQRLQT